MAAELGTSAHPDRRRSPASRNARRARFLSSGASAAKSPMSDVASSFQASTSKIADVTNAAVCGRRWISVRMLAGTSRRWAVRSVRCRQERADARLAPGEPQRPRDAVQDLARRARSPALLEPHVVLGGDVRQDGHLLAAQSRRAAPQPDGQAESCGGAAPGGCAGRTPVRACPCHQSAPRAGRASWYGCTCLRRADRGRCRSMTNTRHHPSACSPARSSSSPAPAAASARPPRGCSPARAPTVVLASRGTDALDSIVAEIRAEGGIADAVTVRPRRPR